MTIQEHIHKENDLLRTELGSNPLYAWKHSSKLFFRVQKIVESEVAPGGIQPQYEYKLNRNTGLIEPQPIYVDMPMLPMIPNSWLLARFCEANQEQAFKQRFGVRVEYPADGIWQPIKVTALRPGLVPNRKDTWNMIYATRASKVAIKEFFDNAEEDQDKREKADRDRFVDMCRDKFSAGMEVPGTKGGMSLFNGKPDDAVILKNQSQEIN